MFERFINKAGAGRKHFIRRRSVSALRPGQVGFRPFVALGGVEPPTHLFSDRSTAELQGFRLYRHLRMAVTCATMFGVGSFHSALVSFSRASSPHPLLFLPGTAYPTFFSRYRGNPHHLFPGGNSTMSMCSFLRRRRDSNPRP